MQTCKTHLYPCVECGSKMKARTVKLKNKSNRYDIVCPNCYFATPFFLIKNDAIKYYNEHYEERENNANL